jgi:hypothetical protein
MTDEQMLPYFADCAERAERLRQDGTDVVLVTGCELSLFARGYLPGDTFNERIPVLAGPDREAAVNAFLRPAEHRRHIARRPPQPASGGGPGFGCTSS